jgi:hypothetical protein
MSSSVASQNPHLIKVTRDVPNVTIGLHAGVDSASRKCTDGSATCGEEEKRVDELCDDGHGQLLPVSAEY